jgi:galactose mutarotase-like enzyme
MHDENLMILEELWNGFQSVVISNQLVHLRVLPTLGAKIVELRDVVHDYEWLWSDESRPLRHGTFGASFEAYDISGADECFPNIGIGPNPINRDLILRDHGDLWSRPWKLIGQGPSIDCEIFGERETYSFRRKIALEATSLVVSYSVTNLHPEDLIYMWSFHPLFRVETGMSIELRGGTPMTKEFGFGGRMGADGANGYLGHLDHYLWPFVKSSDGETLDLSNIALDPKITDKVVLMSPPDGFVKLINHSAQRTCAFNFDPLELPFLGICFNLGAWPFSGKPATWVAFEPTTAMTDRLDEAHDLGTSRTLKPGQSDTWGFKITIS